MDEKDRGPRVTSETRDKVEAAALQAFELYGIGRVRVEDVSRLAGVSRPTVYRVFPDREALVEAIFIRAGLDLNAQIHAALDVDLATEDALVGIFRETFVYYEANPHRQTLMQQPGLNDVSAQAARSEALRAVFAARWSPYLSRARARGLLRDDVTDEEIIRWFTVQGASFMIHGRLLGGTLDALLHSYRRFVVYAALKRDR